MFAKRFAKIKKMNYLNYAMTIIWVLSGSIILCLIMAILGRLIKDKKSLFAKIGTGAVICSLFGALIFFYGTALLQSLKFNLNSLEDLKNFLGSRIIGLIAMIVLYIFAFFKLALTVRFVQGRKIELKDYLFILTFIVFDIAVIPDIYSLGLGVSIYLGITLCLIGLACIKLVFSILYRSNLIIEEGGAC